MCEMRSDSEVEEDLLVDVEQKVLEQFNFKYSIIA